MSFTDIELTEEGRKLVKLAGWGNVVIGSCALTSTDHSSETDYTSLKTALDSSTPLKVSAYGFRPYYHTEQLQMRIQMLSDNLGGSAISDTKLYLAIISPMKVVTVTDRCTCGVDPSCPHCSTLTHEVAEITDGSEGTVLGFCETDINVNLPVTTAGYSFDASINVKLRYEDSEGNMIDFLTPESSVNAELYDISAKGVTVTNMSTIIATQNVQNFKI